MSARIRIRMIAALLAMLPVTTGIVTSAQAEVVDRIVAKVNDHIILQSDWDNALRYEALLNGRPLDQFTDEDRGAVLDRLIDQELLAEQMKSQNFQHASESDAATRVAEARKQYPGASTVEGWQEVLARFDFTEKDVIEHVRQQIDLMRLVDAHLRPEVQIDSKSIEAYYRDNFVPQLKQSGAGGVALADVTSQIRKLLTEQRVNELLANWLQTLRSESKVTVAELRRPSIDGVGSQ